jgi:hypothetical protein
LRVVVIAVAMLASLSKGPAWAISCTKEDFARAVDQAGAALRKLNAENTPHLHAKMRQLKERKGWPDVGFEEKAHEALQDERVAAFDAQANSLLAKIDSLGSTDPASDADCAKLQELTASSLELQATIKTKTAYIMAKLDQMLGPPLGTAIAEPKAKTSEAPRPPAQVASKPPPPPAPRAGSWSTQTKGEPQDAGRQPPSAGAAVAPGASVLPEEEGYTIEEIKTASAGFFGKVSANLGAVIEHLFRKSGRPSGYILGTEGGGAFLAGVRYGSGTLYLRSGGTQKIHWHGPSLGTDVGVEGSKTLFLVYRLQSSEQLYSSFTGVDGSAYFVGGIGATLMSNGAVVLAPIRSGLGLRLGANIGYVRFTPRPTWNPF